MSLQFLHTISMTRDHICAVKACVKFALMTRKWNTSKWNGNVHYNDVIMSSMASQISGVLIGCLNACSVADQRKHQSSMSLAFVRGIHRWPVNSPHKGPVTQKRWRHHGMKIIWWNGPQDIKTTKSEENRPTVPWKGRNESPLIDIPSSIKAIQKSVIDIMDIHNSNMDVYNSVMYIHNCIMEKLLWISKT